MHVVLTYLSAINDQDTCMYQQYQLASVSNVSIVYIQPMGTAEIPGFRGPFSPTIMFPRNAREVGPSYRKFYVLTRGAICYTKT